MARKLQDAKNGNRRENRFDQNEKVGQSSKKTQPKKNPPAIPNPLEDNELINPRSFKDLKVASTAPTQNLKRNLNLTVCFKNINMIEIIMNFIFLQN